MKKPRLKAVLLAGLISAAPLAAAPMAINGDPPPGALNSFTGEVRINGMPCGPVSAGRATLGASQTIETKNGMAELLLTPGSFLRIGRRSGLMLESAGASGVRLRLRKGEALIEVLYVQPPIVVEQGGAAAAFEKPGLYGFNARRGEMAVYSGEARFSRNGIQETVGAGLGIGIRSLRKFSTRPDPADSVLAWSDLRSKQLSSESAASAQALAASAGEWRNPAWYWDPWARSYTWLSASGAVTGPFGWPYYSPGYAPNSIPVNRGDSYLYGPPVIQTPGIARPAAPGFARPAPSVPLTAPGVPQFPNNRF